MIVYISVQRVFPKEGAQPQSGQSEINPPHESVGRILGFDCGDGGGKDGDEGRTDQDVVADAVFDPVTDDPVDPSGEFALKKQNREKETLSQGAEEKDDPRSSAEFKSRR